MLFCWPALILIACNCLSVQKMYMVVISSSIVCCSKCKVFTHSTVWWNQLNSLGNTFIHKDVSVSQLKRQRNQPSIFMDILWGNFLPKPWCLWDTGWGQTWSPCSLCSPPSTIRKKTCPVDDAVAWGNICNTLRNIEYNFVHSFCHTCYQHKIWTYTSFQYLPKLKLNLLILKIVDCSCFTVVRSYKHLIR